MEKILLFQSEWEEQLKRLARSMRISAESVAVEHFREKLQSLYRGETGKAERFEGTPPEGSLILFCQVEEKKMDKLLAAMRKKGLSATYKAVLTRTNAQWNVLRLYFELGQEKKQFENGKSRFGK